MLHTDNKIIKHKTGLLNLAEELGNVSKACQVMGYSRDTFYRYKAAADEGGVEALFEAPAASPTLRTALIWLPKKPSSNSPLTSPPMARPGHPMNYARSAPLSLPQGYGPSGCATPQPTSRIA